MTENFFKFYDEVDIAMMNDPDLDSIIEEVEIEMHRNNLYPIYNFNESSILEEAESDEWLDLVAEAMETYTNTLPDIMDAEADIYIGVVNDDEFTDFGYMIDSLDTGEYY